MAGPTILMSSLHYRWATLEEAFARCADEFRLDGIELSLQTMAQPPHVAPAQYGEVAALGRRYGLQLTAHIWDNLPRLRVEAGVQCLLGWLEAARTMGMTYLVIHGGNTGDQAEGIRTVGEIARAAAPHYEAAGVTLCIENHYPYDYHGCQEILSTAEEFLALFRIVGSPAVRFCLDYGHAHLDGLTLDLLARLAPHLAYAHVTDNRGDRDEHLAFGHGSIEWRPVLLATREAGFHGPFNETKRFSRHCI